MIPSQSEEDDLGCHCGRVACGGDHSSGVVSVEGHYARKRRRTGTEARMRFGEVQPAASVNHSSVSIDDVLPGTGVRDKPVSVD